MLATTQATEGDTMKTLFDHAQFDGADYKPARDNKRLCGQMRRVWVLMCDRKWRTLQEIADATGDPHASISAQLRHLRKERFGQHEVNRRHIQDGLYHYQVIPNEGATPCLTH